MLNSMIEALEEVHRYKIKLLYPSSDIKYQAFFKPLRTAKAVGDHLLTMLGMPVTCIGQAIATIFLFAGCLILAPFKLLLCWDPNSARADCGKASARLVETIYFLCSAVIDFLRELTSFVTRSGVEITEQIKANQAKSNTASNEEPITSNSVTV